MKAAAVRAVCIGFPGASETVQWGDNHVFKVGGKMFCVTGDAEDAGYSFKVDDDRFLELTDIPGLSPAPYLARARWVAVDPKACVLSDGELEDLLRGAYEIIRRRLPKKVQATLGD
ncbi:MAG: MmcQ/YjbR family DNA-binding protein [Pseudomonadota bacterium]